MYAYSICSIFLLGYVRTLPLWECFHSQERTLICSKNVLQRFNGSISFDAASCSFRLTPRGCRVGVSCIDTTNLLLSSGRSIGYCPRGHPLAPSTEHVEPTQQVSIFWCWSCLADTHPFTLVNITNHQYHHHADGNSQLFVLFGIRQ